MSTLSLSASWPLNQNWSLRGGVGLIQDGTLSPTNGAVQDVKPGGLMALGFEYVWQPGQGFKPTVDFSVFLSASATHTEDRLTKNRASYFSSDLRIGGRASWIINGKIFPYVSGRLFGGPVSWEIDGIDVTGTDIHHYQIAFGTAIQVGQIVPFVEWAGIGEKAISAGLSYSWR